MNLRPWTMDHGPCAGQSTLKVLACAVTPGNDVSHMYCQCWYMCETCVCYVGDLCQICEETCAPYVSGMCSTHVFHIQCLFITHMNTKLNTTGYIRNIYRCTCGHTCINTSLGKRRRMSCAYRHISNRMLICALHMFCLCMCLCWLVLPYVLIICFYMCQHMYKILFSQNFAILRSYTYVYTYANT